MKEFSIDEFDWDEGNVPKILRRHEVDPKECEEVFLNGSMIRPDIKHSVTEQRFIAFGHTNNDRKLMIVFTVRNRKIRVISARPMDRKERHWYETKEA